MTAEKWLENWELIDDPAAKGNAINQLTEEQLQNEVIARIVAWWSARYYYVDKKKTRVGDKFVWLFLTMRMNLAAKVALKEFLDVYNKAILSEETQNAAAADAEGFKAELHEAASFYLVTFDRPAAILGLIPQSDKSATAKAERIADLVVNEHIFRLWQVAKDKRYAEIIAAQFCSAAKDIYPKVERSIARLTNELEPDFIRWMDANNINPL